MQINYKNVQRQAWFQALLNFLSTTKQASTPREYK